MSELKEWTASEIEEYDDARLELSEDGKVSCTMLYIKSDADKVISELKADFQEACDRLQTANLIKDEQLAETRHQKYKRCLRNAEDCKNKAWFYGEVHDRNAALTMWKWRKRWLALAEKFKDKEA